MRVYGVVGWKNAGKTGLMERLVTEITARGFSVTTVKHAHHTFDVDQPGKDSHRHRLAGAREVMLSSRMRWALMHENGSADEPPLSALLAKLGPVDLVLIEGYKRDDHPKIEAHRAETGNPLIAPEDPTVQAVASDAQPGGLSVPVFDLNDTAAIAGFILSQTGLAVAHTPANGLPVPPQLKNDCFALPPGVKWIPVDEALATLRSKLSPVVDTEICALDSAAGRVLAQDVTAVRANPPAANSAVDGYGFAHGSIGQGAQTLALVAGRAAAGAPFAGSVPAGQAIRILTGALLPEGVDTVVLQEDVTATETHIALDNGLKRGANCRRAGEDVAAGAVILSAGRRIRPADLALLAATGQATVTAFRRLKVGVLSTGDELVEPGNTAASHQTYDANRVMLLGQMRDWGCDEVDLGQVADQRPQLRATLDRAAGDCDVILTSGGASAGDEDHVSGLLREAGALFTWRIALKPGRPLALGLWNGVPVFGLPGNPVAALVCTLIFARPALGLMAGAAWSGPRGWLVPAAFTKAKKAGRREYLRARLNEKGAAEVFRSEGSGRISGLSWAEGLVELDEAGRNIGPGDLVRYLPYSAFDT